MNVVGIAFQTAGRIYSFDPGGLTLSMGDAVIVETARGLDLGHVRGEAAPLRGEAESGEIKPVLRRATDEDLARVRENEALGEQAVSTAREHVRRLELPMRLLRAVYQFDRTQVTLYFSAEGRVDFRQLVRDLASALRCRIQLHQTGARDAAKLLGGIGPCGRTLCCTTWLREFEPVTVKMAKEQSLFLNPTKFSGVCGKLMCCLRYEYDHYRETRAQLPSVGGEVNTADGRGQVLAANVVKETVRVLLSDGREREYPASEVERPVVRGCSVLAGGSCTGGCGTAKNQ
jgi:cell fate regulator YaaT (PSP1 superfamily)